MFRRGVGIIALILVAGCRCEPIGVQPLSPGQLRFTPERVVFEPTYLSSARTTSLEVLNTEGASVNVEVSIADPFTTDLKTLSLKRGEATTITLTFAPSTVGLATSVLKVGNLEVQVEGEGLEVPACTTDNVCASVHFDLERAQCIESLREDGASCETQCVTGGCQAGVCTGALKGCDDADLCTVDACGESTGCTHIPRSCPAPTNPCKVATCDSTSGCGEEDAPDGMVCGRDDCTATSVDVCIAGNCVPRARPELGRCANRWVPTVIPVRYGHTMAFDSVRSRVVVFGGGGAGGQLRDDTWEWTGNVWTQRLPISSPPARAEAAMSFDSVRRRTVLFGGRPDDADTWEWDGTTWLRRVTTISPGARSAHAMAWDPIRQRTVLFGGFSNTALGDTWTWDGTRWQSQSSFPSPGPRLSPSMAWDPVRQRVMLFGGVFGNPLDDTWEWNGTGWTLRTPARKPPPRSGASLAWNGTINRLVLFGGMADSFTPLNDQWEWDGNNWTERQLAPGLAATPFEAAPMVWDSAHQLSVLFGGGMRFGPLDITWGFDGATWRLLEPSRQLRRDATAMTWDPTRQRAVLFGGTLPISGGPHVEGNDVWEWSDGEWFNRNVVTAPGTRARHALAGTTTGVLLFGGADYGNPLADTWLWNGTTWARQMPTTSPSARRLHALSWDSTRNRVVLFGGNDNLSDTWEWDGAQWLEALPQTSPPARDSHAQVFDLARQRTLLFGGQRYGVQLSDTWEWDGVTWLQRMTSSAPSPRGAPGMAYDALRGRTLLFGGITATRASDETWEWNGSEWSQLHPTTNPPAGAVWMVFDETKQKIILFDGNDVWVFLP